MQVNIGEGNPCKDLICTAVTSVSQQKDTQHNYARTSDRNSTLRYGPTWTLSTLSISETVNNAQYIDTDLILFSNKSFQNTYREQVLYERSLMQYKGDNPWLKGRKRPKLRRIKTCYKALNKEKYLVDTETPNTDFVPHDGKNLGSELYEGVDKILSSLSKYAGQNITDELIVEVEGVVALFVALQGTTDFMSAMAVIALYMRKFFDKSMTSQALSYLKEIFSPQDGVEDELLLEQTDKDTKSWVTMMKNIHSNWTCVRDNPFFSHLSKILGLVVTMEMCKLSSVTFKVKDLKVLEPDMKIVHGSAVDIIDAALGSVTFFVEVFSLCHEKGSLRPLFVNDTSSLEIDEEFVNMCTFWDLVKNGNLKKVKNVSDNEFDRRLETLCTRLKAMLPGLTGFDKKMIMDKYLRILTIKNDYVTKKISSGIRKAPFTIELFGGSSQGKSTIGEQIISALLTSAELPTGKEYQASYNAGDKYMSTWTTDKLVMLIDDIANEKSDFVERPPTRAIIDLCNNQAFYANMADLASKGKVFVEPEIVLVTTNVKDLDARAYSNCPYSIQRRMHVVITVQAKPEFQLLDSDGKPMGIDSSKVQASYRDGYTPVFDDIWTLTLERAVQPKKMTCQASYCPIVYKGKTLKGVSFVEAINFLIDIYHEHKDNQQGIVDRMDNRSNKIELCGIDGCKQIRRFCLCHQEFIPNFGEEIVKSVSTAGSNICSRISSDLFGMDRMIEGAASFMILRAGRKFAKHWDWMSMVPTPWLENDYFCKFCMVASQDSIKKSFIRKSILAWSSCALSLMLAKRYAPRFLFSIGAPSLLVTLSRQKLMVQRVESDFRRELVKRNTVDPMIRDMRDKHVGNICKAGGIVAILYGLSKVYKAWRSTIGKVDPKENETHGSLEPKTQEDIDKRDSETSPWTQIVTRLLPSQDGAKNTTSDQLIGMVDKNLTYGSVSSDDGTLAVNCLFLRSNVALIPQHYFKNDSLDVTFRKEFPEKGGGKFVARISKKMSYMIPDTDLAMIFVPNGGSFRSLSKYLPTKDVSKEQFAFLYREKTGNLISALGLGVFGPTGHTLKQFNGLTYRSLTTDTRPGMCGATLVSKRGPVILGFHLGGKTGTPSGCAGTLTLDQYNDGISFLKKQEGFLLTGNGEHFEEKVMGHTILTKDGLHKKSPVNYQPHSSQILYFGSCKGHTTFKSSAKPTLITEHVMDVMDAPNIYMPPTESPQWEPWQDCLASMATPALPFDPDLLSVAVADYKKPLIPIFKSDLWKDTRPLTDLENWNGIPGKKFIDRIKASTSVGFPLSGKKEKYLVEVEPIGEYTKIVEPVDIIQGEIERLLKCYLAGERAFPIAKACKKDEIHAKKKCRIFFSNPVALTFLVRKYFLPLLRILQFYPKLSECAVGINSHGPEWAELYAHVVKFGIESLVGGDYKHYDQKLAAQLLLAALRILIDLAKFCDYSCEDIMVMEAMCGDLVYAIINFNGDLIGLTEGSHISGNSLTVILNGICGSLNMRCYFYSKLYKNTPNEFLADFQEFVALITYGDDNLGSSHSDLDFTIKGASEFLAEYGQTYTMPDKDSELTEYLAPEDLEFLKRKNVYHPKLKTSLGALVDKSCFKMLHYYLRDKKCPNTEEYACALNIDTALSEWFNHGEDVYEMRREQLREVAERAKITYLCEALDKTYDEKVIEWLEKYA